jgi:hypothetical protein
MVMKRFVRLADPCPTSEVEVGWCDRCGMCTCCWVSGADGEGRQRIATRPIEIDDCAIHGVHADHPKM